MKEQRVCPRTLEETKAAVKFEMKLLSQQDDDFDYNKALEMFNALRQKSMVRRITRNRMTDNDFLENAMSMIRKGAMKDVSGLALCLDWINV